MPTTMPKPGDDFPTPDWMLAYEQYRINDAWYSGDQEKLQRVYASNPGGTRARGDNPVTHYNRSDGTRRSGGLRGIVARMFNGRILESSDAIARTRLHAPIAENLANLSADLLMAEPPEYRFVDGRGKTVAGKSQDRLDAIVNSPDHHRAQSHAAEITAGLGASVLTAHWDPKTTDRPWMQSTPCDAAIPEFAGTRLVAVNLYTLHPKYTPGGLISECYIHIERHEIGAIIHGLYRVDILEVNPWGFDTLGGLVPLSECEATEHLADIPGSVAGPIPGTISLPTGIQRLTASWWRNRPTRTFRKTLPFLGRADFEGAEQFLDAADEVWSSWLRDIKIARARLIVPEQFLDLQGPGMGPAFDDDREVLTPLAFTDLGGDKSPISAQQFKIRADEHASTLMGLTQEITRFAGYSLSSYTEQQGGGGAITATEVTDRTSMTERTRDNKFLTFTEAAEPLTLALLDLDRVHYRSGVSVPDGTTLTIQITELSQIDPLKEAQQLQYLRAAQAASTDTLVRLQHGDWDEERVQREVILIRQESGLDVEADPATVGRVDENGNPLPPAEPDPTAPADPTATGTNELDKIGAGA